MLQVIDQSVARPAFRGSALRNVIRCGQSGRLARPIFHALSPVGGLFLGLLVVSACASAVEPERRVLQHHEDNVYALAFSPDGKWLASASGDNTAIIWDLAAEIPRHVLRHEGPVYTIEFFPGGQKLATGSGDGRLSLWDLETGELIRQEKQHADAIYSLTISRDASVIVTGGGNGNGGDTIARIWDPATFRVIRALPGHTRPIYGVAMTADQTLVATASSDRTVRLWEPSDGTFRVLNGHTSDVYRCGFSRDGQRLVTASQDATVRVWDVAGGREITTLAAGRDPLYAALFVPQEEQIVSIGDDGKLRMWTGMDYRLILEQKQSREALYAVAVSADGRWMAMSGADAAIELRLLRPANPHP